MVFENIEKLKRQYTDKYVVVDENCPELRRFKGLTGTVKTVNMSGRALVEFDGNNNIGWYDIELDYLRVIDQPLPKPDKKAEKPAAKAAPAPKPAAKPAAPAKMSVADMLAAARSGAPKSGPSKTEAPPAKPAPAPAVEEPAEEEPAAEIPVAVAKAPPAEAPKKAAGGKLPTAVADIVAYCRKVDVK